MSNQLKGDSHMSFVDEIEKLDGLRQRGAISEQEYQDAKESILAKNRPSE